MQGVSVRLVLVSSPLRANIVALAVTAAPPARRGRAQKMTGTKIGVRARLCGTVGRLDDKGPTAPTHVVAEGMRVGKISPLIQLVVPSNYMLHISFEPARQSRLLSMLTHRAGGKGDAPHT